MSQVEPDELDEPAMPEAELELMDFDDTFADFEVFFGTAVDYGGIRGAWDQP